jgi:hypothetical protein
VRRLLEQGAAVDDILESWREFEAGFQAESREFWLYQEHA